MTKNDDVVEAKADAQLAVLGAVKKAIDEEWAAAVILDLAKAYNQLTYSQGGTHS